MRILQPEMKGEFNLKVHHHRKLSEVARNIGDRVDYYGMVIGRIAFAH